MKKKIVIFSVLMFVGMMLQRMALAQTATIKINSSITYQKVTGFGGFVNSPQFAYNYMSVDEIKKLWGKDSETGYTIMRMYLPIGESSWSQSLETAKLAKSLGLTIFASPWSMPAEWKTNNNIAAVYTDGNGVEQIGSLKDEYYSNYANYLNNYVTYLHNNGVDLDAISIQNEPDMKATYAGCIWTPQQIAGFVKNYGSLINCKIIAPESVGLSDNFADAFVDNNTELDIYAGHQYGGIQNNYKKLQEKGKEVWMTEYLINWNADESTTRNFNWSKDAFTFAGKLNSAMVSNINAWIHYASKRYYGLMGDGTNGTTNGEVTKRGYILAHYAKYTTGTTRIDNTWTDDSNVLQGSSYLSVTGDSIIVMVINPSANAYTLTVDLPFYTKSGKSIKTTETVNMSGASVTISEETCRPKVTIDASSFTTLIFTKSNPRPASQMSGSPIHYSKIENQTVTNTAFGTAYQLSGKTVTFDHSNPLISTNTTDAKGYLKPDDSYNYLVFHINTITSAASYTSATTTLYYINGSGSVSSHNYGTITFNQSGNYDWVLDISRSVLTDGCTGIIGISNSNYSSILTIQFGDVFFKMGNEKMYKFTGVYSKGDSYLLDALDDMAYTSLDFTGVSGITSGEDWNTSAANKNCIYYVAGSVTNANANVVAGTTCSKLTLTDKGGDFYVLAAFSTNAASYSRTLDGYGMLILPFEAAVPTGVKAYTLQFSATNVVCTIIADNKIPANTPVLIQGTGTFRFDGSGNVSTPHGIKVNDLIGVYISVKAPANSYYLKTVNGVTGFYKVTSGSEPAIMPFSAYYSPATAGSASVYPLNLGVTTDIRQIKKDGDVESDHDIYDLLGRPVYYPRKGVIYIRNGKKEVFF